MSEKKIEMDQAKIAKFRERLERISRRRFLATSLVAGGGVIGILTARQIEAQANPQDSTITNAERIPQLDSSTRCRNTQELLRNIKIKDLFAIPLKTVLGVEKAHLDKDLQDLIAVVEECLDSTVTLYDLFTEDIIGSFPGLDVSLIVAETAFLVPFRHSDPQTREETKLFLRTKDPFGARTFMDAFSGYTIPQAISIKMTDLDFWDQNLAIKATKLGIWRERPKNSSTNLSSETASPRTGFTSEQNSSGNDHCAYYNNGQWACRPKLGDKCNIVDGIPTAGSDVCPL